MKRSTHLLRRMTISKVYKHSATFLLQTGDFGLDGFVACCCEGLVGGAQKRWHGLPIQKQRDRGRQRQEGQRLEQCHRA